MFRVKRGWIRDGPGRNHLGYLCHHFGLLEKTSHRTFITLTESDSISPLLLQSSSVIFNSSTWGPIWYLTIHKELQQLDIILISPSSETVRQEAVYRNQISEKSEILPYCFSGGSDGKESACNAGDPGSIPGSRRSPGGGNGNLLQYYCMENSVDRGAWWATVHGVTESDTTEQVTFSHLGGSQVEIRTLISDHLPLVGSFPFCWFSCHTSSICRQIPTWGLAKKELWSKDTEIDFLFF